MVNYQLGKIYKIVCRITGEVYVGSTCEPSLARRLGNHRTKCKTFHEKNKGSLISSYQIILRGDYYIDLLENCPCNSSDELRKKEREYYDRIECINKFRPYQFVEERKADQKIYDKKKTQNMKFLTEEEIEAKKIKGRIKSKNYRIRQAEKKRQMKEKEDTI